MSKFANEIVELNKNLNFTGRLPTGYKILNPFLENPETMQVMSQFYQKFYNDSNPRHLILAINPGRFGAGLTGVPFSDTKSLEKYCGITMESAKSHEVSALFVYDMIQAYGGVKEFYQQFYINNIFPLAITQKNKRGKWVNANYYDNNELFLATKKEIVKNIKAQLKLNINQETVFILGKKNGKFFQKINKEYQFFETLEILDHPRYIQQYKTKLKPAYIEEYLATFAKHVK